MNTHIRMMLCLLALSAIAGPCLTAPTTAQSATATEVVREYLADRATNDPAKAYALLSPDTQKNFPFSQFTMHQEIPTDPTMTPALRALIVLFLNSDVTPGYDYHVQGVDPADAATVLVSARQQGDGAPAAVTLKIVTSGLSGTPPRIDLLESFEQTDPVASRKAREAARATASLSNLKQIALGILQYAQTHNNRLPDASRWVDEILPYLLGSSASPADRENAAKGLFHDPSAPAGQEWSYAFNRNLSGLPMSSLTHPATTVLVFESTAGTKNAADTGTSVPHPGRHSEGSNYAFADGHVARVPDRPAAGVLAPTFAP
jgi:prepilin-type processing-associated H-X9-DG protein